MGTNVQNGWNFCKHPEGTVKLCILKFSNKIKNIKKLPRDSQISPGNFQISTQQSSQLGNGCIQPSSLHSLEMVAIYMEYLKVKRIIETLMVLCYAQKTQIYSILAFKCSGMDENWGGEGTFFKVKIQCFFFSLVNSQFPSQA